MVFTDVVAGWPGSVHDSRVLRNSAVSDTVANKFPRNTHLASFKLFLEVILLWGGPRLANFVALNLCGLEVHSIYRWRNQHRVVLNGGILLENFKKLACVYEKVMKVHGLLSVPVLAAEDETAIIGQVC